MVFEPPPEDHVDFGNIYLQERPIHPKEWLAIELIVLCNGRYHTRVPLLIQYRWRAGPLWFNMDRYGKIHK